MTKAPILRSTPTDWKATGVITVLCAIAVGGAAIVWTALQWRHDRASALRGLTLYLAGAAIPVIAFELYKFASLGLDGYAAVLRVQAAFLERQNVPDSRTVPYLLAKTAALSGIVPPAAGGLAIVMLLAWWRSEEHTSELQSH